MKKVPWPCYLKKCSASLPAVLVIQCFSLSIVTLHVRIYVELSLLMKQECIDKLLLLLLEFFILRARRFIHLKPSELINRRLRLLLAGARLTFLNFGDGFLDYSIAHA